MNTALVVIAFVAGVIAGSSAAAAGMLKERKRLEKSRNDLRADWLEFFQKERALNQRLYALDERERLLRQREGSFQGRPS